MLTVNLPAKSDLTAPDERPGKCIHELFEARVEKAPEAVALVYDGCRLSCGELNRRSNRLARALRNRGAGPEVPVGVYFDNRPEAVVAVMGILKSGGAFVPLDPASPRYRLDCVIQDSRLPIIVTSAALANRLPANGSAVFCIEDALPASSESSDNLKCDTAPDNAACVVYTSGSSAQPRGVIKVHRGIVGSLEWASFQHDDVCAQNLPLSYGFSVRRLFPSLLLGVPLVIVPDDVVKDFVGLAMMLEKEKVTDVALVPSALRQLLDLDAQTIARLNGLRTVTVGGEALFPDLITIFQEKLPQARLFNSHGSTETGPVTTGEMTAKRASQSVAIGRPVVDTDVLILDEDMQPVPDCAAGELYVSGVHLTRGYLGQPRLTAEKFLPHPFGRSAGQRLYRTGDLGRYNENGEIEFLGRADNQVKIRGFRVDLGEVEAALEQHQSVQEATAKARRIDADLRLVAYVVRKSGTALSGRQLQDSLLQRLPAHMVPSLFVFLDRLPRGVNGKIDAPALPLPDFSLRDIDVDYKAPGNAIEATLLDIWRASLHHEDIGTGDHFVELGGDSLIAIQVMNGVRERFGLQVPVTTLFRRPTIAGMAAFLAAKLERSQNPGSFQR